MLRIHDTGAIDQYARRLGIDPHRLRRLRTAFYKHARGAAAARAELPDDRRGPFAAGVSFHTLQLQDRRDSDLDGASKLVFRAPDGALLETVILRIATGRTSLCVSSQAGCAARCSFCATGQMGLDRNLAAEEILDQVAQANELLRPEGRQARNVVFMGMGEPLHNEGAVHTALDVLASPRGFGLAPRRLVISTVGVPEAMVRLADRFPAVRLALSLHSARPSVREQLIPLTRRHGLDELRRAVRAVTERQGQPVLVEYLLLAGLTDTPDDLAALVEWLRGLSVHVNLIPYNPVAGRPELTGTDRAGREAFAAALRAAGVPATVRYSLGADIAAACGQLVQHARQRPVVSVPSAALP
jgi:23S rRNA (adenine2503-C2)-methyltransferase